MRKENEFGGMYYQINFTQKDLEYLLALVKWDVETIWHPTEGIKETAINILDRIEKELGIEQCLK
jgi:hypothetical protein